MNELMAPKDTGRLNNQTIFFLLSWLETNADIVARSRNDFFIVANGLDLTSRDLTSILPLEPLMPVGPPRPKVISCAFKPMIRPVA